MKFFKYLLVSLLMLLPTFANADTIIKPPGKSMWEMHVMGNGPVIASVLESVKLVISPDAGGGGFRSLLLFMAILGFCILAIQAGFNPGQNLFKMFGYLFVVWVVSLTTTQMKAHMLVMDPVSRTETAVMNVPAIVAIPAAVVSGVGHYLTTTMQQAYSTAGSNMALTESGFDIFGKIQSDLDSYTISRPELQRSMAAYVSDCVIPAIAQKRVTSTDLMTSPNLMVVLSQAQGDVFLTRYWPVGNSSATPSSLAIQSTIVTCTEAYKSIATDMEAHAQQMLTASAANWTRSGVMVPYEQMLQTAVEAANIGKTDGGGTYGRPTGIITQKALINTMAGDFRTAAVQTGNNELLMGLQISQAEQSQKSGWVTSAAIFKNMMGYVYTTLQAFIYAIVPIVAVALLIPGLGKKIFVNYGQILVWLTLWEPMLSIVNYLVTLFRIEGMRNAVAGSGGFTVANTWVISEGANNMVIAASFLGTMVPILTWGLVTGAMAFNEFISHGIGSSFAMSAGANAATGTTSLNNANMNNVSNNGYSTAHKSTVGNQSVMAHENAGALTKASDHGGTTISKDGDAVKSSGSFGQTDAKAVSEGLQGTKTLASSSGVSAGTAAAASESSTTKAGIDFAESRNHDQTVAKTGSHQESVGKGKSTSHSADKSQSLDNSDKVANSVNAQVGGGLGGGGKGGAAGGDKGGAGGLASKVKTTMATQSTQTTEQAAKMSTSSKDGTGSSTKADSATSVQDSATDTHGSGKRETVTHAKNHDNSSQNSRNAGSTKGVTDSTQLQKTGGESATSTVSRGSTLSWSDGPSDDMYNAVGNLASQGLEDTRASVARSRANFAAYNHDIQAAEASVSSAAASLTGAGGGPTSFSPTGAAGSGADAAGAIAGYGSQVAASTGLVNAAVSAGDATAKADMRAGVAGATSMLESQHGVTVDPTGAKAFATDDSFSAKKTALGAGMAVSAVGSVMDFASAGRTAASAAGWAGLGQFGGGGAAAAGGMTAGGLALGAAGIGAAGLGGWYMGRELVDLIGEERVNNALEPTFRKFDQVMGITH